MNKLTLTNEEVEVLKTWPGMLQLLTDTDIEKLKDGTADEKQVYWVEKKLRKWKQEQHAQEKQLSKQMHQPVSRGEMANYLNEHYATRKDLQTILLRQEVVVRLLREKMPDGFTDADMDRVWQGMIDVDTVKDMTKEDKPDAQ